MPIARSSVLWGHVLTSVVANLFSLVMTARANHVEPFAYLNQLFEQLPHALKKQIPLSQKGRDIAPKQSPDRLGHQLEGQGVTTGDLIDRLKLSVRSIR